MIVVDEMLRDVAKWLRILGVEVKYVKDISDTDILGMLNKDDILVTSDEQLCARAKKKAVCIFIEKGLDIKEKVLAVFRHLGMKPEISMKFCSVCGGGLEKAAKDDVEKEVPEKVLNLNSDFYKCRECGKVFWKGGHWKNIKKFYTAVLKELEAGEARDG